MSARRFIALALLALPVPARAQLPASPIIPAGRIHLGGYASIVLSRGAATDVDGDLDFAEAAASLLVSGGVRSFSYFGEIEAAGRSRDNFAGEPDVEALEIERLYGEYAFADAFRIRLGRFLTPVGQWNEIHAEPLTWTAVRPMTTYRAFAKSTTGVLVGGTVPLAGRDAGYAVYYAPNFGDGRDEDRETRFIRALGGRAAVELVPDLVLGASLADVRESRPIPDTYAPDERPDRDDDADPRTLVGADLSWRVGRTELLAEGTLLSATADRDREEGAFLQAATRVWRGLHVVVRGEYFDPVPIEPARMLTVGAVYRARRYFTFKLERQFSSLASNQAPDGWFVSASVLF